MSARLEIDDGFECDEMENLECQIFEVPESHGSRRMVKDGG